MNSLFSLKGFGICTMCMDDCRYFTFYTVPKSGEKKSLIPFFLAGCGSAVRGCKTFPSNGITNFQNFGF